MRTIGALLLLTLPLAASALPLTMQHQGRLWDAAEAPLTGTLDVTFRLYDVPSGGTSLWEETAGVSFENGYFSVLLGESTAIDTDALNLDALFLSLQVGASSETSPRATVGSVPSAFHALTARSVDGDVRATSVVVNGTTVIDSDGRIDFSVLSSVPVASDSLADLGCSVAGDIAQFDGTDWVCAADADTVLSETEVEVFAENDPLNLAAGTTVDGSPLVTDWGSLPSKPSGFADNVDDDLLASLPCETGQQAIMGTTGWSCGDAVTPLTATDYVGWIEDSWISLAEGTTLAGAPIATDWSNLPNIPADFADEVDSDSLATLNCGLGEIVKESGAGWVCAVDKDTQLNEAQVEAFIENGNLSVTTLAVAGTTTLHTNNSFGSSSGSSHSYNGSVDANNNLRIGDKANFNGSNTLGSTAANTHTVAAAADLNHTVAVTGTSSVNGSVALGTVASATHTFNGAVRMNQQLNVSKTATVAGLVSLTDGTDASMSTSGALLIGPQNSSNLTLDGNEIIARNNGGATRLYLNEQGGAVYMEAGNVEVAGNVHFGNDSGDYTEVWGDLRLSTSTDVELNRSGALTIGGLTGGNQSWDNNEIMARSNGAPATLFLQSGSGITEIRGPMQNVFVAKSCGGTNNCYCPSGYRIVSGGGFCPYGLDLYESYPNSQSNYWRVVCSNGLYVPTEIAITCGNLL